MRHVFAFFRRSKLEFVEKKHEKDDVCTYSFRPQRPIRQIAGQHGLFMIPGAIAIRPFSLASAPEEQLIKIGTHIGSQSTFKRALDGLEPGQHMYMQGPYLDFTFQDDERSVVMLAQGIGITPFRSMLLHAQATSRKAPTTLIHVEEKDHTYRAETEKAATKSLYPTTVDGFQKDAIKVAVGAKNAWFYLSGSPRFVKETTKLLLGQGVQKRAIKKDSFLGY